MALEDTVGSNLETPFASQSSESETRTTSQSATPTQTQKENMTTDDFATALETFTPEPETASGDDHVLKGTVLKVTPTRS